MRLKLERKHYLPKNGRAIEDPAGRGVCYVGKDPYPWAMAFHGKQAKPDWNYRFRSIEQRDARVKQHFANLQAHEDHKQEWKEKRKELRKEDNSVTTKNALIPYFGKDVSVTRGRGTAHHWLRISVKVPRPADCRCHEEQRFSWCEACRETRESARRVIDKATEGIHYSSYCQDDGYNTMSRCVNTEIHIDGER